MIDEIGKKYKEAQDTFYTQALSTIKQKSGSLELKTLSSQLSNARNTFVDALVEEPLETQVELVQKFTVKPPRSLHLSPLDRSRLPILGRAVREKGKLDMGSMAVLARALDPTSRGR